MKIQLSLALVALFIAVAQAATCPDYKAGNGCLTGSCNQKKPTAKWKIPSNCPLLEGYGTGKFVLDGPLAEDTDIPGSKIKASPKKTAEKCCQKCKRAKKCTYWQWLNMGQYGGLCFTYAGTNGPVCTDNVLVKTRVGAKCAATVNDDPHLVGAHGTHYDFNGLPNKSFCLMSDSNLHINMKMTGYYDNRTESATVLKDGKAVRTWIRELGLLWFVGGEQHMLRLVARAGKETARGEGFLALAEVDDSPLPRMEVGDEFSLEGGLTVRFEGIEKKGPYDVDFYTVQIADLLDMEVRLRVANPLLQTPEDAYTHISLGFNDVKTTPAIHGVLGQTYREDREARAIEFTKVAALLHHNIAADAEEGKGFLDGVSTDYISSSVLDADCKFSAYQGWATASKEVSSE